MTKTDLDQIEKILNKVIKPLDQRISELERQQFRLEGQYHRLDVKIDRLDLDVGQIKEQLQEMEQKVDTLILVTTETKQEVAGIWDKFAVIEEKTGNEIKKIKKHVGLSSN